MSDELQQTPDKQLERISEAAHAELSRFGSVTTALPLTAAE